MILGDIFENFMFQVVVSARDRIRRAFEVMRLLVSNCTCCMTKTEVCNIIICRYMYKTGNSKICVG